MKYLFTKMHGLGNDFVILDLRTTTLMLSPTLIQRLSNRRYGIGCDQFIVLETPAAPHADIHMRIFNADGGEVKACGNATRCMGAYLQRQTGKTDHIIETAAGFLKTAVQPNGMVAVDIGIPSLAWQDIPLREEANTLFLPIDVPGLEAPTAVNMGNPHLVFFVKDVEDIDLERFGKELTHHPLFPEGTNVEIVEILTRHDIRMRVWERGTGITLACATGACASVVAGVKRGLLENHVTVHLDGGDLEIHYDDTVVMYGPVTFSFEGSFDAQTLAEQ
jgi:diaminopimelate epimerase